MESFCCKSSRDVLVQRAWSKNGLVWSPLGVSSYFIELGTGAPLLIKMIFRIPFSLTGTVCDDTVMFGKSACVLGISLL